MSERSRLTLPRLLARPAAVVMDGGMGTTLEDRGVHCQSALWSSFSILTAEGRTVMDRIHEEYVEAGAEILIANTHNASLAACRAYLDGDGPTVDLPEDLAGIPPDTFLARLHRRALMGVRRAIPDGEDIVVAAGIGSAEGPYATTSRMSADEAAAWLEPQVRVIRDLDVDLVLFETLTTISEIEAVARLAREHDFPPFGAGLTCGDDGRTLAGVSMAEAWSRLREASPAAVFIQCTRYDHVERALAELVQTLAGDCVPGVYANDGRIWEGRVWAGDRVTPEEYAEAALVWRDAGARIIGGCCGTSPEHVRELRRRLG